MAPPTPGEKRDRPPRERRARAAVDRLGKPTQGYIALEPDKREPWPRTMRSGPDEPERACRLRHYRKTSRGKGTPDIRLAPRPKKVSRLDVGIDRARRESPGHRAKAPSRRPTNARLSRRLGVSSKRSPPHA